MDWQFITHHLASGYIPVSVALVLYFILLGTSKNSKKASKLIKRML